MIIPQIKDVSDKLYQTKRDQRYLQDLLNRIDTAVSELMIPESEQSSYKSSISFYYAAIVFVLITYFFDSILGSNGKASYFFRTGWEYSS